jgi:hypothetical protein
MHCLFGCLGFFAPRVTLVILWLTTQYLQRAYETALWPLLGFLFMPVTTLAYAYAQNDVQNETARTVVVVVAVLIDLGVVGGGARWRRRGRGREQD